MTQSANVHTLELITYIEHVISLQAALVYEATAVCTYSAGQKIPFTKHVRIEGIGTFGTSLSHLASSY